MGAVVAFVYADLLDRLNPIYHACAAGLIDNVREVFGVKPLMITDDNTQAMKGADVMRVKRKVGPMSWRLIVQCVAHEMYPEILFTEPDVRFKENLLHMFEDKDFDVTVCDRERKTTMKDKPMVPITLGTNFSRSRDFWKECAKLCLTYDRKSQLWGGDMDAVWTVMNDHPFRVKTLPAAVYNHVPWKPDLILENGEPTGYRWNEGVKVLHFKGTRKTWLFPKATERLPEAA